MKEEILDEMRRIFAAASPGPWYFASVTGDEVETLVHNCEDRDVPVLAGELGTEQVDANWDLCAAARTSWPKCVDEITRLQALALRYVDHLFRGFPKPLSKEAREDYEACRREILGE